MTNTPLQRLNSENHVPLEIRSEKHFPFRDEILKSILQDTVKRRLILVLLSTVTLDGICKPTSNDTLSPLLMSSLNPFEQYNQLTNVTLSTRCDPDMADILILIPDSF